MIALLLTQTKKLLRCFWQAGYIGVIKHDAIEHAGYLTYLSMLAVFPFLVLLVVFGGWLGQGEAGAQFVALALDHLPPQAVEAIKPRLLEISDAPPQGLVTVSILGALWTASSLVQGWRTILNSAYHVGTPPAYWLRRLMSIVQLILFIVVVIVAMTLIVFAPIVLEHLEAMLGARLLPEEQGSIGNAILYVSSVALLLVVANLYYILPNIKQTMMDVIPGAAITVFLWIGAASLFTYYLSHVSQMSLIYGSLGGIIASLIFFFIINLLFILGAELNYQFRMAFGSPRIEEKEAV